MSKVSAEIGVRKLGVTSQHLTKPYCPDSFCIATGFYTKLHQYAQV